MATVAAAHGKRKAPKRSPTAAQLHRALFRALPFAAESIGLRTSIEGVGIGRGGVFASDGPTAIRVRLEGLLDEPLFQVSVSRVKALLSLRGVRSLKQLRRFATGNIPAPVGSVIPYGGTILGEVPVWRLREKVEALRCARFGPSCGVEVTPRLWGLIRNPPQWEGGLFSPGRLRFALRAFDPQDVVVIFTGDGLLAVENLDTCVVVAPVRPSERC